MIRSYEIKSIKDFHQQIRINFDEDTLLLLLAVYICQIVILCQLAFKKRKERKIWTKESLRRRETLGT